MGSLKKPVVVNVNQFKAACTLYLQSPKSYAIRVDGFPGTGKSEIIKQIAEENHLHLIETRLAFKDNPELAGHMIPNREKGIAEYLRPEDIPDKENTLWFLDEVNRVYHPSILQTLFQMISVGMVGVHKLPKNTYIFLAGNLGDEDDTIVTEFDDSALETRLAWFKLEPNFKEWLNYAETSGVHQTITAFLEKNSEYWQKFKGRVWFQVNETITATPNFIEDLKKGGDAHRKILEALVSTEAINEYIHFVKEFNEIDEKQILLHFNEVKDQLKGMDRERLFQLNMKILMYFKDVDKNEKIKLASKDEVVNALKYSFLLDKDTASEFVSKVLLVKKVILQYQKMKDTHFPFTETEQKRLRELFV